MSASSSSSEMATPRYQSTEGRGFNVQEELYQPWAMEQCTKEHVSFASFVRKFKLSDLQDAQDSDVATRTVVELVEVG